MSKLTYKIQAFGCAMNVSDGERIRAVMDQAGFKQTDQNPDMLILVACSVRQSAIDRIWGQINSLKHKSIKALKQKNRSHFIILTGCVLVDDKKKFKKRVDVLMDIKDIKELPQIIKNRFSKLTIEQLDNRAMPPNNIISNEYLNISPIRQSKFSALVPIMTGCNNFCAYCAVPYTRGREYSRPAEEILTEVKELVEKGYREIILIGQNVNSYHGEDTRYKIQFPNNFQFSISNFQNQSKTCSRIGSWSKNLKSKIFNFPQLLRAINAIPGNFWLRFMTSHPKDLSDELIRTMADCDKVCEQINLPAQAGDNAILKKMNRHYTVGHYKKLIKKLRRAVPDIAISTDVIVGFPGETRKQFTNTVKLFEEIKYDMAHIAEYSPRPGTAAAKLKDDVPATEKTKRRQILTDILKKTALENNQKYIGKIAEVLAEKCEGKFCYGKTRTCKHVKTAASGKRSAASKNLIGKMIKVKIKTVGSWGMEGELII